MYKIKFFYVFSETTDKAFVSEGGDVSACDFENVSAESKEIQEVMGADDATSKDKKIPTEGIQVIL